MKYRYLTKTLSGLLAALLILAALPGMAFSAKAAPANPAEPQANPVPQAIWTEDNATLTFVCEQTVYTAGGSFRGQTVTDVWSGSAILNSPADGPAWEGTADEWAEKVVFESSFAQVKPARLTGWFEYFTELIEVEGIQYLDTSQVTDMSSMFRSCNSLESLDLSTFDTSKVTSMENMFTRCGALTELNLQNFTTQNVTSFKEMFFNCPELTVLDLSSFVTEKLTEAGGMFANCTKLGTIFCQRSDSAWQFATENTVSLFASNTSLKGRYGSTTVSFAIGNHGIEFAKSAKLGGYFTPKYMTVTFDANEGSGSMAPQEIRGSFCTSAASKLTANTFTRDDHAFMGWNTKPDGSGTAYGDQAEVTLSEDLTLYAQWKEEKHLWKRLAGGNRLETMQKVLQESYEDGSCKTLVVSTAMDFPDALAGASLAGLYECPIVLTLDSRLLAYTKDEIQRLASPEGCTVYILGGTAAVSDTVKEAIREIPNVIDVQRVAGSNREQTALEVYRKGAESWGETVILATAMDYADTLAVSPYAYAAKTPILLARGNGKVGPDVQAVFDSKAFKNVIIVGGTGVISEETENYLKDELGLNVVRLAGANRFETGAEIIKWELGQKEGAEVQPEVEMTMDGMGVATGMDFSDALGSVSLLGKNHGVLLLTMNAKSGVSPLIRGIVNDIIVPNASQITKGYIFGGSGAVDVNIETMLEEALQ